MNQLSSLSVVYVDGTGLKGNLTELCALPSFETGKGVEMQEEVALVADCGGTNPQVFCSCCICCNPQNGSVPDSGKGCSVPVKTSRPLEWEQLFTRTTFQFNVDPTND
jgi:hypothetical protein